MEAGRQLYAACCETYGVRPNSDILQQVDRPDLMNLRTLDASKTFLGNLGVHAVLDFARQHRGVRELLLPRNDVDGACVERLCLLLLERHPSLATIDLSDNAFATAPARQLWNAARRSPGLVELRLDGCTLSEEWRARLQRALDANKQLFLTGYYRYGPDRPLDEWQTSFVLVAGGGEAAQRMYQQCVLRVNSYLAATRVRVAPIFVIASDTAEQALTKVNQCREPFNYNLTFCTVLLEGGRRLGKPQAAAVTEVLRQLALQRPAAAAAARARAGDGERLVHRCMPSCFVYVLREPGAAPEPARALPASEWLRLAGLQDTLIANSGPSSPVSPPVPADGSDDSAVADAAPSPASSSSPGAAAAASAQALDELLPLACTLNAVTAPVRCESDLHSSLSVVFSEDPTRLRLRDAGRRGGAGAGAGAGDGGGSDGGEADGWLLTNDHEFLQRSASYGALHVKKSAVALNYIDETSNALSVPLVLFGARGVGKAEVLAHVGAQVCRRGRLDDGLQRWRVLLYVVDQWDSGIVVFLYWVLRTLDPAASLVASSVEELCLRVRNALAAYAGPPTALMVGRADMLDPCGSYLSTTLDWLPSALPAALKVVVTVDTDSRALPYLRALTPQPHECLVPPLSERNQLQLVKALLRSGRAEVPGLEVRPMRDGDEPRVAERAYLAKEGSATLLYAVLSAAYLQTLVKARSDVLSDLDTADMITHSLPQSTPALIEAACRAACDMHDAQTVRCVLLCLAAAPLPVPELRIVCEEIGPCAPYSAVPALLQLAQSGLVSRRADSRACLNGAAVREAVLGMFPGEVDRACVLVQSHLLRLVLTRSAEMSESFRHVVPLLVQSGTFGPALELVANTAVLDCVLQAAPDNRLYVIDAYFRLLLAADVVRELGADGAPVPALTIDERGLYLSLREVQRGEGGSLFQAQLLHPGLSPLSRAARERPAAAPYPYLRLLNDGAEDTSVATWQPDAAIPAGAGAALATAAAAAAAAAPGGPPCGFAALAGPARAPGRTIIHLHARGDLVVACSRSAVYVLDARDGALRGRLTSPFEMKQPVRGALLSVGSRVVVVGAQELLLWDFESHSSLHFDRVTTDPEAHALDAVGVQLLVRTVAGGGGGGGGAEAAEGAEGALGRDGGGGGGDARGVRLCVLDVPRRYIKGTVAPGSPPARFCGDHVLTCEGTEAVLFDNQLAPSVRMAHGGAVREVACSADGRLIATSVGSALHVWTHLGELVHTVDCGLSAITRVCLDPGGAHVLTEQPEGPKVWRAATGALVAVLANPVPAEGPIEHLHFSADGGKLLGRSGRRLVVWGAPAGHDARVITAPLGYFTYVLDAGGGRLLAALSDGGGIKVWGPARPAAPGVEAPHADKMSSSSGSSDGDDGPLSANCLRNPRVCGAAVRSVSVNAAGTRVVCVDERDRACVYSLEDGARLPHRVSDARAAVFLGAGVVAYVPTADAELRLYHLGPARTDVVALPRAGSEQGGGGGVRLWRSPDEAAVAVSYAGHDGASVVAVVAPEEPAVLLSFPGGGARVHAVSFFGSSLYAVGSDGLVQLWGVQRRTERARHVHSGPPLLCACGDGAGLLYLMDAQHTVYRAHADSVAAPGRAAIVVVALLLPRLTAALARSPAASLLCAGGALAVVAADGTLVLAAADRDAPVNRLPGLACVAADTAEPPGAAPGQCALLLGTRAGTVLLAALAAGSLADAAP